MKIKANIPYFFISILPVILVAIGYHYNLWLGIGILVALMLISPIDTVIYLGKNILPLFALIAGYYLLYTEASLFIYLLVKLFNFLKFEQHEIKEEMVQTVKQEDIVKVKESPYKSLLNQTHLTTIPLRPQGHLIIDNQEIPAKSTKGFIDTHSQVKVVDADMRCVIVEKV